MCIYVRICVYASLVCVYLGESLCERDTASVCACVSVPLKLTLSQGLGHLGRQQDDRCSLLVSDSGSRWPGQTSAQERSETGLLHGTASLQLSVWSSKY